MPISIAALIFIAGADAAGQNAVTELQSRAQFSMWAVLRAPMLLSQSVVNMTSNRLQTYSNAEVIGVGQDAMGRQGVRLKGGPVSASRRGLRTHRERKPVDRATRKLTNPFDTPDTDVAVTMQPCAVGAAAQVWKWNVTSAGFLTNPASNACLNLDDCGTDLIAYDCVTSGGTCAGANSYANEQFSLGADGTLRSALSPQLCATWQGSGSALNLQACASLPGQKFAYDVTTSTLRSSDGSQCMTVGDNADGTNVWGRPLSGGSWALVYLNTGLDASNVTCDFAGCLGGTGWEADQVVAVRDLWAHADLGNFTAGSGWNVTSLPPSGGVAMFRMTPVWGAPPA